MAAQRLVVWFRNDLRLTDNPTIAEAAKRLASDRNLELIPVYCFDPRHFKTSKTSHGYKKTGVHRARFMIEAVTDLRSRLRAIGSDLVVHHTTPESIMPSLLKTGAGAGAKTTIMAQEEVCWEELAVDKAVRASVSNKGGRLELHWGYSLYHRCHTAPLLTFFISAWGHACLRLSIHAFIRSHTIDGS
jgi:deoxyribodipyrimidine photo-lyase